MEVQKNRKRIVNSSAALISIAVHAILILVIGGMVALKFYNKRAAGFIVEEQKPKLERRKLQMPVKTEPFVEQMTKPKLQTAKRITANTPQMVNIPEQGEYVKMAPMPTFKGGYTNFVQMDRTLEFNSKYRDVDFGISAIDFFGTRGKAEKVVVVVDTSESMLYDDRGGIESYQMVHEDLHEVIGNMRSATLFNVVLFDGEDVALFNPSLIPATPVAKTNVLAWISGINTNLAFVGLPDGTANYVSKKEYDVPMETSDVSGWLKGFQAAVELKPEIIFVLAADWGTETTLKENISYFVRQEEYRQYQKIRAEYFLQDEGANEDMEEFITEYTELHAVALKMLELENQARLEEDMQPKIVRDWDEILYDNDVDFSDLPLPKELEEVGMTPSETRYTTDEVFETIFVMTMNNYRHLGFPRLNFVMLAAEGMSKNSTEASSFMTSDAKFKILTKAVDGRFRYLEGMSEVDNVLSQDKDDIQDQLEEEKEETDG